MPRLSDASAFYVGSSAVSKLYLGPTEVWTPSGGPVSAAPTVVQTYSDTKRGATSVSGISAQADDWLVAVAMDDYNDGSALVFGGTGGGSWSAIGSGLGATTGDFNATMASAYKACPTTGTYTVTVNTAAGGILLVYLVRGATGLTGTPFGQQLAQSVAAGARSLGPVTTTAPKALLIGAWKGIQFETSDGSFNWGAVSGMTLTNLDEPNGNGNGAVGYETLSATGSYTRSSTPTSAPTNGFAGKLFAIAGT